MAGWRRPKHQPGAFLFDPVIVGHRECEAWAAYYRREWLRFLLNAVGMVRAGFGLPWRDTFRAGWYTTRANQVWAPEPDNDPDAARRFMERFYSILRRHGRMRSDPGRAAELEVDWWRLHRTRAGADTPPVDLTEALTALYAHVYDASPEWVRAAAAHRVAAMRYSDQWVRAGRHRESGLLVAERRELVACYSVLRAALETT